MKILKYYLLAINIIGFAIIMIDKFKARKNKWRIRENTIFFLAIVGAATGELISMLLFHHKNKKKKFIILIPIIIIIQATIYLNLK